jgi:hypothetical protein
MTIKHNEALANRFHTDIFIDGNFDAADEIIFADFVIHSPGLPPEMERDPEGDKRYAHMLRSAFPDDLEVTHADVITSGDKVVIRWTSSSATRQDKSNKADHGGGYGGAV